MKILKKSCGCSTCKCENNDNKEEKTNGQIKILGSGCKNCINLENNVLKALEELNINMNVVHVKDFVEISNYGVMSTPALVINEQVVSQGKILSKKEVEDILKINPFMDEIRIKAISQQISLRIKKIAKRKKELN